MLQKLVELISSCQEVPQLFGHLHLSFILGVAITTLLLCLLFRDASDGAFRTVIALMFLVMLLGECFKQFVHPYSVVDGVLVKNYDWSTFPFQLCSTPLYVLPFIAALPDSRLRDAFACYTSTFALIGGLAVYLVPSSVFVTNKFINIQTMVHHGLQIVSGIYVAVYYRRRFNRRFYLDGLAVFTVMFGIANLLNTVFYDKLISLGKFEEGYLFNMFYINPRLDVVLPFCRNFFNKQHPVLYIFVYYAVLSLISYGIARAIDHLYKRSRRNFPMR